MHPQRNNCSVTFEQGIIMNTQIKIHTAADWEQDLSVVNQIEKWTQSQSGKYLISRDLDLLDDMEGEWFCFAKASLKQAIDESDIFLLVVGEETLSVMEGSCSLCENYRSFSGNCAHGRVTDKRGFLEFQCATAKELNKKIIVLYSMNVVDKSKCPQVIRELGQHIAM